MASTGAASKVLRRGRDPDARCESRRRVAPQRYQAIHHLGANSGAGDGDRSNRCIAGSGACTALPPDGPRCRVDARPGTAGARAVAGAGVIDSQSIKAPHSKTRSYDAGKKIHRSGYVNLSSSAFSVCRNRRMYLWPLSISSRLCSVATEITNSRVSSDLKMPDIRRLLMEGSTSIDPCGT